MVVGRFVHSGEAFVANGHARASRDGVETVGDGRLTPAQLGRVEFVLSRQDDLARHIELELAVREEGATVHGAYGDAPSTANAEVRAPLSHAVGFGRAPSALQFVGDERAVDPGGMGMAAVARTVPPPLSATACTAPLSQSLFILPPHDISFSGGSCARSLPEALREAPESLSIEPAPLHAVRLPTFEHLRGGHFS